MSAVNPPLPTMRAGTRRSWSPGRLVIKILLYLFLLIIAAIIALPFLWAVSTAFKDQAGIYAVPPLWIPSPAITDNFVTAWTMVPLGLRSAN